MKILTLIGSLAFSVIAAAQAPRPVTVDNFVRAESDMYMAGVFRTAAARWQSSTIAAKWRR